MTVPLILVACCAALCAIEANAAPTTSNVDPMLETESLIPLPRYGLEKSKKLKDFDGESNELVTETSTASRTKRYVVTGCRWNRRNLTYRFDWIPEQHSRTLVEQDIAKAFATWANHTDLTFTQKTGEVDILLKFGELDGVGETLAHSDFPCDDPVVTIVFDKGEPDWGINGKGNDNFYAAAVHEVGHALGINHSNITGSFMNTYVSNRTYETGLHPDDISAIQAIYPKVPHLCDEIQVDAFFRSFGHTYVIRGKHYWEVTNTGIVEGYPKLITSRWPDLSAGVYSAFTSGEEDTEGETVFFKDSEIWRYRDSALVQQTSVDSLGLDDIGKQMIRNTTSVLRVLSQQQVREICAEFTLLAVLKLQNE